ncbi:acid beta-fructofuranosidase-like [Dorcoceras hygrometricum]|uniref:beta-fructofuranosidase n=1 Tax=Dorcoceras hygrometricum TaxID=472368 RepID=A0A2Z7A045_9LAMI|nr:acid beta-fructofuranosidase-like [Dorcoceras hygrometricum]
MPPMATNFPHAPPHGLERAISYAPIPSGPGSSAASADNRTSKKLLFSILLTPLLLLSLIILTKDIGLETKSSISAVDFSPASSLSEPLSRGIVQGVSKKAFLRFGGGMTFPWSYEMLSWQRTTYHFQPEKNWMNGPLFYNGWYHLFYQYNPDGAVWGNITWGHAVSKDLIHWLHLPFAMVPDQWYDINGVWTGSATILPDGGIIILYTGDTYDLVQVQCLAYPANSSDPLLLEWVKDPANPVLVPPPWIGPKYFRDPSTAWLSPDTDKWRLTIGSTRNKSGISIVYETKDFKNYELLSGYLHQVPGTGMWECIDFYPISMTESNGLDTSANGPGVKHVMKASLDDEQNDYYALGTYDPINNKWIPDDPELDVGIGLRYDYGKYYASKTFFDQNKERRILWGWIRETDAEDLDILKGWASVQSIPRTVVFDDETGKNLLQWPVKEVESLRSDSVKFNNVDLGPGSITPLEIDSGSQLDIVASFKIDNEALDIANGADVSYACPTSGGAANRGTLGPFGILVLADNELSELTPIYFYVTKRNNGEVEVHFCADELRSSVSQDVDKIVYGSKVPVLDGEKLSIRSLVDHSIVESFAQGGRRVITSRVYPTKAINDEARVFLFNNATSATITATVKIWKMKSADIRPFPPDQF